MREEVGVQFWKGVVPLLGGGARQAQGGPFHTMESRVQIVPFIPVLCYLHFYDIVCFPLSPVPVLLRFLFPSVP